MAEPEAHVVVSVWAEVSPYAPIEDNTAVGVGVSVRRPVGNGAGIVDAEDATKGVSGVEGVCPSGTRCRQSGIRGRDGASYLVEHLGRCTDIRPPPGDLLH